jgi:hypothetical protein
MSGQLDHAKLKARVKAVRHGERAAGAPPHGWEPWRTEWPETFPVTVRHTGLDQAAADQEKSGRPMSPDRHSG